MTEKYLDYIQYTRCLSKYTVTNYRKCLKKFEEYLCTIGKTASNPKEITLSDIYEFIARMNKSGLCENTVNWFIDGVRSYFHYLVEILDMDVVNPKKIKGIKVPEKNIGYFSESDKKIILSLANKGFGDKDETQLRNKLLVYMLLHLGLRTIEIAKIKVYDIGENMQVIGKGGRRRFVYIRPEILDMIYLYLGKRRKQSDYLFAGHGDGHLTPDRISHIFMKMSKEAGIHIHAHRFRHTFAVDLLHIPGSNIYNVAKLLGHKNISTTQIYLGTNSQELKKLQFGLKFA